MFENRHFDLLGDALSRFFGSLRSNSESSISGGAIPTIQSVHRKVLHTAIKVTVDAFFPPSRFLSAVKEIPLRSASVSNDKFAASRAARTLAPNAFSISSLV